MKKLDLFEAIGETDERYLNESEKEQLEPTYKHDSIFKSLAIAAVFVLIFGSMAILPRLLFDNTKPPQPGIHETTDACTDEPPVDTSELPPPVEVIDAYGDATKAANLFRLTQYGLAIDNNDTVTVDGMPYYRVTSYESYNAFIEYLRSLFSEEVTAQLLESAENFKEYDGMLYLAPSDGASNICIGSSTLIYNAINEKRIELTARVNINDYADRTNPAPKGEVIGQADVVFPYELIDGRWVFTDFPDIDLVNTEQFIGTAVETSPELYNFYEVGGLSLILPKCYEDRYRVLMNSPEALEGEFTSAKNAADGVFYNDNTVFWVSYVIPNNIPEYDIYSGYFFDLYKIVRYTVGEYEQNILASITTRRDVLGFDGEYYYVMQYPAAAYPITQSDYYTVTNAVTEAARLLFGKYNNLEPASPSDFYAKTYTYDSDHKYYQYYPYGTSRKDYYYTFVLSQPADKGADGIWCVERWYAGGSDGGNIHPEFPASGDISAAEYYANLQRKVSNGQVPVPMQYLDPTSVSVTFARDTFGHDFADASYLVETDILPEGKWTY